MLRSRSESQASGVEPDVRFAHQRDEVLVRFSHDSLVAVLRPSAAEERRHLPTVANENHLNRLRLGNELAMRSDHRADQLERECREAGERLFCGGVAAEIAFAPAVSD